MSELRVNTLSDAAGSGPVALTGQHAAKHTLSYDQVSVTIDDSENVSSVTDNTTSDFTVNYTNNMAGTLQPHFGCTESKTITITDGDTRCVVRQDTDVGTASCRWYSTWGGAAAEDRPYNATISFGGLA